LKGFAKQMGHELRSLDEAVKMRLETYSWPGNVRQLRNMMEWVTIMAPPYGERKTIRLENLPPEILGIQSSAASASKIQKALTDFMSQPLREARESFERDYLSTQMKRFKGNVSQTAEFVGMERSALHRKLKSLDISMNDAQDNQRAVKKTA
jgi:two-component system nitrogen regulation response regulator NtrX